MTQLKTFLTRLRSYFKTGNIKALKEAFIAGSHLLMHTFKVAIVLLLILKFYKISSNSYTIKPFSVSKFLTERGFTGETVIKKIMDERQNILHYNDGSTSQSRIFFRATSKKKDGIIETKIEEGKESGALDIDGIFKTGKKLLNYDEKIISGEITQPEDTSLLTLKIYMPNGQTKKFNGRVKNIDNIFMEAAEYITEQTTPQYLAEYLIKESVRRNDGSTLEYSEKLLDKVDKLLSTLEYNAANDNLKKSENNIQIIACRTSWHLAKAMKYSIKMITDIKESTKWKKEYYDAHEMAWRQADLLKSSNDLAYYVLKLSTLMSIINGFKYYDPDKIKEYKGRADSLIQEYSNRNPRLLSKIWARVDKSDYFEDNQAAGFINLSIGYLSYIYDFDNNPEDCFKKAIKCFHKQKAVLSVDNNEIAAINSLVYYFKDKAQVAQKKNNIEAYNRYYDLAKQELEKAINANKSDGNIYDTFAETIYDLNGNKTDSIFYKNIEFALANAKPVDGITIENYRIDTRWRDLIKNDEKFNYILDSIGGKKKVNRFVQKKSKQKKEQQEEVLLSDVKMGN